ncbi:MAG: EamA family transporter [Chitinivibrionales bacterium]|nr:EamA family transporter [Chitinivibrionales bacterium]
MQDTRESHPDGQAPIDSLAASWLLLLIVLWAANSVVVKLSVRDFQPLWAAFIRFCPSIVFLGIMARHKGAALIIPVRDFLAIALLGSLLFLQIFLFNLGSQYTTGGRVTLFIFAYPLMVPWISALLMAQEGLKGRVVIGTIVAFAGLAFALRANLGNAADTLKGDLIELASAVVLALGVAYNKRLMYRIDKWTVLFWRFTIAVLLFLTGAVAFERFEPAAVASDAWIALVYQAIVVSMFCFASFQHLLSRHNSSSVAVFFFATPLAGMLIGMLLLGEPFDPALLIGALMVGVGILVVNNPWH